MGGGLGGGSSDAASVLIAPSGIWGCGLSRPPAGNRPHLRRRRAFFVFGETAFAEGVGEKLQALDVPPAWYVMVAPPVRCHRSNFFCARVDTR